MSLASIPARRRVDPFLVVMLTTFAATGLLFVVLGGALDVLARHLTSHLTRHTGLAGFLLALAVDLLTAVVFANYVTAVGSRVAARRVLRTWLVRLLVLLVLGTAVAAVAL